jgi:FkbM family methyltransferase
MWKHGDFFYPFEDPHKPNTRHEPDKCVVEALEYVTDWSLALDGGAHVGVVSRLLNERFKSVLAIELAPDTVDCFRLNNPGVEIIHAALGAAPGRVSYEGDKAETSTVRRVIPGDGVEVITIDSLGLKPSFIKLDLQGYDLFALQGARETLRSHPVLIFEHKHTCFARYGVDEAEPVRFLKSCGYKNFKRSGANVICYGD